MAVVTDYTLSSEEILVHLINNSQTPVGTIDSSQLLIGEAAVNADEPETNGDTRVTLTGVLAGGLKGTVEVTYNRIAATEIAGELDTIFEIGAATQVSDLLPLINARYGVNIAAEDIVDAALPALTDGPENFSVTFVPGALVFTGTMALSVVADAQELNSVITTTTLDGLAYTPPSA